MTSSPGRDARGGAGGDAGRSLPVPVVVVLAVPLGAVLAVCGLFVHRHVTAHLPWGLLLVLAATLLATRAAGLLGGRAAAIALAAAYAVVLFLTMSARPEGDYLVAADALGYAFLLGSLLVLGIGVVWVVRDPGHGDHDEVGRPRTLGG